jgi:hypothetical protein
MKTKPYLTKEHYGIFKRTGDSSYELLHVVGPDMEDIGLGHDHRVLVIDLANKYTRESGEQHFVYQLTGVTVPEVTASWVPV